MSQWRIHTLSYPVPQVFAAAVAAAADLGFGINQLDRAGGHVYLTHPSSLSNRGWPLDLAVTDSGLGTTVLRISWEDWGLRAGSWPARQDAPAGSAATSRRSSRPSPAQGSEPAQRR